MTKSTNNLFIIGVDVGGTKIATGLVAQDAQVLARTVLPTPDDDDSQVIMDQIYRSIDITISKSPVNHKGIQGIGVVAPGPLDPRAGVLFHAPNIPAFKNVPVLELVQARFGIPTRVENDANAAGLAEALFGAGVGHDSVFYVTVSTGIGTGIVINERIFHGKHGTAGEGGHVTIDHQGRLCPCGRRGCIEAYASGTALTQRTLDRLGIAGVSSMIVELAAGHLEAVSPEIVAQAANKGDTVALELIRETGVYLAIWLGGMIGLLDPDIIVIGGGLSSIGDLLFDTIRDAVPEYSINPFAHDIQIVPAQLQRDVGILGAAALHFANTLDQHNSNR